MKALISIEKQNISHHKNEIFRDTYLQTLSISPKKISHRKFKWCFDDSFSFLYDDEMKSFRKIKTSTFNSVEYEIIQYTKLDHVLVLDKVFKSAYLDLEKVSEELRRKSDIAKNAIFLIYGKEEYIYKLQDICKKVFEKLNSCIKTYPYNNVYRDKKQDPQDSVFASTRDITPDIITFYKPFFDTEETPLEDKGSILIHEVAHLVGLTSDRETKAINSAEALRNFLLLCTGIQY